MRRFHAALVIAGVLSSPSVSYAQDWPSRPVRIVSTFAAGGTADILARIVAESLSTSLKQQFFVETRAGAGGTIGVHSVATSPPDGYNFAITNVSHLVLQPISQTNLPYHPTRDLITVAFIAGSPVVFSVNPKSGIKTLKDFVERGREKALTYSSSGLGSMGHLVGELFAQKADTKIEHVPYKGASQGLADLVGGHIIFASQTVSSTAGYMRSGTLAGLAVSSSTRMSDYPDLPTFKELGYPDVVSSIWFALSGPANLPPDIVKKMNEEIGRIMVKPDVQARLQRDGAIAQPMSVEEIRAFIDNETKLWKPVVERAGLVGVRQ